MKVKVKLLSRVQLFGTPWTVAHRAPPSMGFSRQEYCSGLPFPSPGDLPDPGIEPRSPALEADTLTSEPPGKPPLEAVLVGINYLVFRKELIIEGSLPIPPYTQHHLLWMQTSLWYVCGGSFRLAHDPFHSTRFYSIHFSSPVTICFKSGIFSLLLSRESHGRRSPVGYSPLGCKELDTTEGLHFHFQCQIGRAHV